jgi:hypothetical protein
MLQQLYQQHQQQQKRQPNTPALLQQQTNGIRTPNGTPNMFDTQTSNGTSIQFASNTGTGGTWQRNNTTPSSSAQQQQQSNNGYMNGYSMMGGLINGSNGLIAFKCCECSITKNSCEELEIHIKTEHLNWLPFRCLKCPAVRAADTQMREHMFSAHKNEKSISLNHYAYIDNPNAKRELQTMLDRALSDAAASISRKSHSHSSSRHPPQKRHRTSEILDDLSEQQQTQPMASATITVDPKRTTNDILAQIQAARSDDDDPMENGLASVTEGNDDPTVDLDEFTSSQLSQVFGGKMEQFEDYSNGYIDGNDSRTLIENISALLGNPPPQPENTYTAPNGKIIKTRAPRGSRQVNCVSKKRVLGECSRCQKPVTAGARQMHMFYHLGKDYNTYRFKCKFDDCEIEHYRKDQMENHQSKQHGRIDPEMMEDRSQELADMVQQLSMELLGTVGNQPGPTAEKAQIMYDNQQKEIAEAQTKKRKRYSFAPSEYSANGSTLFQTSPSTSSIPSPKSSNGLLKLGGSVGDMESHYKRSEEHIKCLMCEKTMLTRVKGFHILSHLFNDLGIIRFACKHCPYKNERRQSVSQHGKREHQDENCVEDSLDKYDEEVKSMSKACFGIEQSFVTRSKKSELDTKSNENVLFVDDLEDDPELDENGEASELSEGALKHGMTSPVKDPLLASLTDVMKSSTPKGNGITTTPSSATKKKSNRRFGTRKPKSKKQKLEMAKLRELSLVLGGAQYFRKRANDTAICQKCFKPTQSRLTHHACSHLEDVDLFKCPECELGHTSRELVLKHMKDLHNSTKVPIDNRLIFAQEIKNAIKECYPEYFIDAPIPTAATVEKLKGSIDLSDTVLGGFDESVEHENDENVSDAEENHVEDEESEQQGESHEAAEEDEEIPKLFPHDAIEEEAVEESNDDAASIEAA